MVADPGERVGVSLLSHWEISLKYGLGKLELPGTDPTEIPGIVRQLGLEELQLDATILSTYHRLPRLPEHRDPFDRLLVWHAICSGRVFITQDSSLSGYAEHGLKTVW